MHHNMRSWRYPIQLHAIFLGDITIGELERSSQNMQLFDLSFIDPFKNGHGLLIFKMNSRDKSVY